MRRIATLPVAAITLSPAAASAFSPAPPASHTEKQQTTTGRVVSVLQAMICSGE
ncbi:hypothetical protein [Acetobacter oeni]|uniref:hypothetical protein n=1 Tax=Acetobacter oeni TaxID=304077 RepID=UPI001649A260|nr:hypothetical protein [Acetobacter oeni]MBB3882957.1 hypothetical protein [Acetobacter oeni]